MKRTFDIWLAIIGLIFLFPLFMIIALLIKISNKGPVFFIQKRVGQHAKIFSLVKFRTMIVNNGGSFITTRNDNRVTKIGAVLRKYKIDELPELWNILKGDMSFVGPRPDVPGYADQIKGDDRKILKFKPGLTAPSSMKYRNEEQLLALQINPQQFNDLVIFPDKIRLNVNYVEHWSIWLDIKIIIFTLIRKDLHESYFK